MAPCAAARAADAGVTEQFRYVTAMLETGAAGFAWMSWKNCRAAWI
jgi:hypothetical protein